jgi:hypothetical protein
MAITILCELVVGLASSSPTSMLIFVVQFQRVVYSVCVAMVTITMAHVGPDEANPISLSPKMFVITFGSIAKQISVVL